MRSALTIALSLFIAAAAAAQSVPPPHPENFERILVPVFFFGPGAGGSQWSTRVAAINGGTTATGVFRPVFEGSPLCGDVCGCGISSTLNPGDERYVCRSVADPFGLVLFVPKTSSADVQFQSWITEQSRGSSTEVQVVREKDLRTTRSYLLNLPADSHSRVALRVYDAFSRDGAQVQLRAFDPRNLDHIPIFETTLTLHTTIRNVAIEPFPWQPAFAMIGDLNAAHPELLAYGSYFIELTPLKPLDSFWALATITDNATQQVTTVTAR